MRAFAVLALLHSCRGLQLFGQSPLLRKTLKGVVATIAASTVAFDGSCGSLDDVMRPPPAAAAVASMADVGVGQFLVKDGGQFLRLTIPLGKKGAFGSSKEALDVKMAQENLELCKLRFEQVGFTNPQAWGAVLKDANTASNIIKSNREYLISGGGKSAAESLFDDVLSPQLDLLGEAVRAKDVSTALKAQEAAASALADLRLQQLPAQQLPFTIPEEFAALPRLTGRATVELQVKAKRGGYRLEDGKTVVPQFTLLLELDGYHAPLTAGNFADLVSKGYYNGLPLQKVEQLTVQTGKPPASLALADGETYVDPATKKPRTVPLELFYKGDTEPSYGYTSDDDLRATETQALPFQAYGALGMARNNEQADTGSTQFFMLKWMQALIAPGRNTLDGFYSCFGYVTKNEQLLSQVSLDDVIVSAKIVAGKQNLILP
ncbi:cyclophilin type peptidyl-prolyl cis-trans isomerase/CLD-domain-containing protein [Ochromonadaceae sp. CCMP2298]|nr:cyclophilin type peptidyl-prolyl cis-trans isomerase/CLD-domain-containing protein [Ochromonadaceae sp. CCMP2298]|mmetsp:Transcript_34088/g.75126  ORF Transcript_34088/g.75126 Transcript_34088/m.75126 type:complete len:434 (-) Transcript_34088:139-1440(-)